MQTGEVISYPARVELCGKAVIGGKGELGYRTVTVGYSTSRKSASYAGLQTCGLIWHCPVCSAKIREERAREVDQAVRELRDRGGDAVMITLTIPHNRRQSLATLLDAVANTFRKQILNTAAYRGRKVAGNMVGGEKQEFGIVGTIRALEVTYGGNGWHPHLHVLLLTNRPLVEWERQSIAKRWLRRWAKGAERLGLGEVHPEHGVKVTGGWAQYVAKVQDGGDDGLELPALPGREMARSDAKEGVKGSLTPFQLLDYADGRANGGEIDQDAVELWQEFVRATRGRQAITWSRGLKAALLVEDVDDDELAAADDRDRVVVATIHHNSWRELLMWNTAAQYELLCALEEGGPLRAWALLEAWGVDWDGGGCIPEDWLTPWD